MTARQLLDLLTDLPDALLDVTPVDLVLDHALAGHGEATECHHFEVAALAPLVEASRGTASIQLRVDWEAAG